MNPSIKNLLRLTPVLTVVLYFAHASAASFELVRIALTFDDNKAATIVERGANLNAQAEISYSGSGLLQAAWEVAGPNPDGNNPQYRTLANVQQALASRNATTTKSPSLPTASTGVYLVKLKITEPSVAFETPIVRYSVIDKK